MGCTIPGCGSSGHNRRTHDKHVPPGEPLIEQGDPLAATRGLAHGSLLRAELEREARASIELDRDQTHDVGPVTVGDMPPAFLDHFGLASSVVGDEEDPSASHGPDAGQSVVQAATSGDQDPITADDIRAIPGVDHECEPAPGQVYFCRHCGEDLMVPLTGAPEPVAGSGLDEFAPEVVEAVSRIGDEMVTPHGPGCTLADPCDECRRYMEDPPVDYGNGPGQTPGPAWDDETITSFDVEPLQPVALVRGWLPARTEVGPMDQGALITPWRTVLGPDEPIRITLPGVYELDATEYHDPAVTGDWLSNSDARQLIDDGCPAQFRYDRDNGVRKVSAAFSMGHAVHAAILGKGEAIAVRPLVNPADPDEVWDSWRKKSAQRWKAEQEAAGRSVILPEDAAVVEAMAAAVHQKPRAHDLLSQPGRPEVALFWVDPVTGVKRRCLVDYLPDGPGPDGVMRPVDIKSADEVAPNDSMEKKLYDHCWHRQAVTIADGIRALGLADEVHFHFIVQSKKAPHLVTVVDLDADAERIGGIENMRAMLVYKECVETGVWPDYAEDTVTLTVPPWISRLYEDEIEVSH